MSASHIFPAVRHALRPLVFAVVFAGLLSRGAAQGLDEKPYVPTPEVVKGMIGALSDPYEEVVLAAIQDLIDWKASAAAPDMVKLLSADLTQTVRADAFQYFVALGPKARPFLATLQPYLGDALPGVRERVVNAIAASGAAAEYQEAVLPLLSDPRKEVRVAAARCLGQAGPAARAHRDALLAALARAGSPEFKVALLDALTAFRNLTLADVAKIFPFLNDRNREVRIAAVAAINSATLDAKAAGQLATFAVPLQKVREVFRAESPEVRGAILRHSITDAESAQAALVTLATELGVEAAEPRRSALFTFGMAGEVSLPHLPEIVAQFQSKDPEMRAAVIAAIRGIGAKAAEAQMELVTRALLDDSEAVRSEALLTLPLCGDTLRRRPFKMLDVFPTATPAVRETLVKAGAIIIRTLGADEEGMERLQKSLADENPEPRIAGCFVAGQLGTKFGAIVLPPLLGLVGDGDAAVQGAAAIALRSYVDDVAARPRIRAALRPLLKDDDDEVRWAALDTLTEAEPAQDPALVDEIAALLNDPDRSVRNAAVRALGAAGPAGKRHYQAMLAMFTDDPDVPPYAAARAVLELGPLTVREIASLLAPAYQATEVLPLVRLTAHGAAAGQPSAELLLRLIGKTPQPAAQVVGKGEIPAALAALAEAEKAPRLPAKLQAEIAARTAELKALDAR